MAIGILAISAGIVCVAITMVAPQADKPTAESADYTKIYADIYPNEMN